MFLCLVRPFEPRTKVQKRPLLYDLVLQRSSFSSFFPDCSGQGIRRSGGVQEAKGQLHKSKPGLVTSKKSVSPGRKQPPDSPRTTRMATINCMRELSQVAADAQVNYLKFCTQGIEYSTR